MVITYNQLNMMDEKRIVVDLHYDISSDTLYAKNPSGKVVRTKDNKDFLVGYNADNEVSEVKINSFSNFLARQWGENVRKDRVEAVNGKSEILMNEPNKLVILLDRLDGIVKLRIED